MTRMIYQVKTDITGNPKGFKPEFTGRTGHDLIHAKKVARHYAQTKDITFTEDWQENAGANFRRGTRKGEHIALMISR